MAIKRYVLTGNALLTENTNGAFIMWDDHKKEMQERVLDAYIKGQIDGAFEERQRGN